MDNDTTGYKVNSGEKLSIQQAGSNSTIVVSNPDGTGSTKIISSGYIPLSTYSQSVTRYRVDFVQLDLEAKLPFYGSKEAACGDLYSVKDVVIEPGKVATIHTGLQVAYIPEGYKLEIYDRSGMGAKGIMVANGVGQIDSDYRGELKVLLYNTNDVDFVVSVGDRIAQVAVEEVIKMPFSFVEKVESTERGSGGFGSTGVK